MIEPGKKVKFHYILKVDGKIIDQTSKTPMEYSHGKGSILPSLEKEMMGMKQGEKKLIRITPDHAFGKIKPEAFVEIPKQKAPENLKLGTDLSIKTEDGKVLEGRVADIRPETLLLDFNHPLAGKELEFHIEIVSIRLDA